MTLCTISEKVITSRTNLLCSKCNFLSAVGFYARSNTYTLTFLRVSLSDIITVIYHAPHNIQDSPKPSMQEQCDPDCVTNLLKRLHICVDM